MRVFTVVGILHISRGRDTIGCFQLNYGTKKVQRIFILLKGVARKPVLLRLSRQLNTDSQNIRQNYMIIICRKMSSDSPRLKVASMT